MHFSVFFGVNGPLHNLDSALWTGKKFSNLSIASVPEPLLDAARKGSP